MATDNAEKTKNSEESKGNHEETYKESSENNNCGPTDLEQQIVQQIEYYFGDINLPKDKFMLEQIKEDDGWIPMSVMLKFQRLSKLSTDPKVVAKALFHSDLMEVDETGSEIKIRRSPEFPLLEFDEARRKELLERSIYCARFPADTQIDTLLNFFNSYGPIDNIIMRKYKDNISQTRKFKGSVFVTFKTKEKGQEFLNLESVKFEDTELTRKWQMDYLADKKQEQLENKLKRSKRGETCEENVESEGPAKEKLPQGATIHLTGDFNGITRESIKDQFIALGFEPAYIEFKMGDTEAHVRLGEENAGKSFIEKSGGEIQMTNSKLAARLLEGEEESTFLEEATAVRNAALKRRMQMRKGGRKGGRGGKANNKGGRKRRGDGANEDATPAKTIKA